MWEFLHEGRGAVVGSVASYLPYLADSGNCGHQIDDYDNDHSMEPLKAEAGVDIQSASLGTPIGQMAYSEIAAKPNIGTWLNKFNNELTAMQSLEDDWNGMGSARPNRLAIKNAEDILHILSDMSIRPDLIAPSAEEGVGISIVRGNIYSVVESYNDGEVWVCCSNPHKGRMIWQVGTTKEEFREAIERLDSCLDG
jgi:hypothetical protein